MPKRLTWKVKPEDIYEFKLVSDPQMSPDGKEIAFVVTEVKPAKEKGKKKYEPHIWLMNVETKEARQLTFGKGSDINPRWSPDGKHLLFLSNRDNEKKGMQLYVIPRYGGEARRMTDIEGGVSDPQWAPKGRRVLFLASPPSKEKEKTDVKVIRRIFYKLDGAGFIHEKRRHLFVLTFEGARPKQLTSGDFDVSDPAWSPDGTEIAFIANMSENTDYEVRKDLYVISKMGGKPRKLYSGKGPLANPTYSPDGKYIAFLGQDMEKGFATNTNVWLITSDTGRPRNLTKNYGISAVSVVLGDARGPGGNPYPIWGRAGKYIYFLATKGGSTHIFRVDKKGKSFAQVTEGEFSVDSFSLSRRASKIVYLRTSAVNLPDVYLLNDEGEDIQLTNFGTDLTDYRYLSKPERFTFKASDGKEIEGWIMKPVDFKKGEKYPAILEIHGGPRAAYGYAFMHEFQLLATRGYVVFYINPRGSAGYGEDFAFAIVKNYGDRDYKDLMEAVEYVKTHFDFVDPDRLGVTGGSYGGYMTNWIVTHTDIFKAAVTQRSISNFYSFFGTSDIGYIFGKEELGGEPWKRPRAFLKKSPISYVENVKTPLLIIHSENDYRCPMEQAEQFYVALKYLKKEVELVRFPDEGHNLSRNGQPHHRVERLNHILRWFDTYLKGKGSKK